MVTVDAAKMAKDIATTVGGNPVQLARSERALGLDSISVELSKSLDAKKVKAKKITIKNGPC